MAPAVYDSALLVGWVGGVRALLLGLRPCRVAAPAHAGAYPSLPLRGWAPAQMASLEFSPPPRVDVVGSFPLRALALPALTVDLAVEMPACCFSDRDVKAHAYTDKRAMYLGVLAGALRDSGLCAWVCAEAAHGGDASRPALLLRPAPPAAGAADGDTAAAAAAAAAFAAFRMRIIPVLPPGARVFPPAKLAPGWNNCGAHVLTGAAAGGGGGGAPAAPAAPTPAYNAAIAEDVGARWFAAAATEALGSAPAARDALLLLKAWGRRRGWHRAGDAPRGGFFAGVVVHLVQTGVLTEGMSALQAARAALRFLAGHDFSCAPLALRPAAARDGGGGGGEGWDPATPLVEATREVLAAHAAAAPVVLLCPSGVFNLGARVSASAATELRSAAAAASALLSGSGEGGGGLPAGGGVEALFSAVLPPAAAYDRVVLLPLPACPLSALPVLGGGARARGAPPADLLPLSLAEALCNLPSWPAVVAAAAARVLGAALGDRVAALRPLLVHEGGGAWPAPEALRWALDAPAPAPTALWVALSLGAGDAARRVVEKGPPPEAPAAAAAFTALWGPALAELRRFGDGTITHAVVWDAAKLGGRAHARELIVPLIVAHMAARHLGVRVPLAALHGGDALAVASGGGGGGGVGVGGAASARAAAEEALLYADVARVCPSLAVERALDSGGAVPAVAVVRAPPQPPQEAPPRAPPSALTGIVPLPAPAVGVVSEGGAAGGRGDAWARGPMAGFGAAIAAFDAVSTALRAAPGLPLSVLAVAPACPGLRYTSAFPPAPHPLCTAPGAPPPDGEARAQASLAALPSARELVAVAAAAAAALARLGGGGADAAAAPVAGQTVAPLEAVLTLSGSSKWPSDHGAIVALKTAFYLKLQYALNGAQRGLLAAAAHPAHLDVLAGGFAFRFRLRVEKEEAVLSKIAGRRALQKPLKGGGARWGAAAGAGGEGGGDGSDGGDGGDGSGEEGGGGAGGAGEARAPRGAPPRLKGAPPTRPEPAPSKRARAAVAAATGVDVGAERMTVEELAAATAAAFPAARPRADAARAAAAGAALDTLHYTTVLAPAHAAAVHAVALAHPSYGPAVRLGAAWLAAQGLACPAAALGARGGALCPPPAPHSAAPLSAAALPHEALELTMAAVFAHPAPHAAPPATPALALLRWLSLLAHWDWLREPLLVAVGGGGGGGEGAPAAGAPPPPPPPVGAAALAELRARFAQARAGGGGGGGGLCGPPLYVVTPSEAGAWRPLWTAKAPSWGALSALVALARASERVLADALCPRLEAARGGGSGGGGGGGALAASFCGAAGGTSLAALASLSANRVRTLLAEPAAERPFAGVARLAAPSLLPRVLLDGRHCGGVRPGVACAAALSAPPASLLAGSDFVAEATAPQGSAAPGGRLVLCVEECGAPAAGAPPRPPRPLPAATPGLRALGAAGGSRFTLSLFRNLLADSRAALLIGFDPLAALLAAAAGGGHALFPRVAVAPDSGRVVAEVGVVPRAGAPAGDALAALADAGEGFVEDVALL